VERFVDSIEVLCSIAATATAAAASSAAATATAYAATATAAAATGTPIPQRNDPAEQAGESRALFLQKARLEVIKDAS
jgi:hypothetical protein